MILYHTSNIIVPKPDITFSRDYLDFGRGFYTTPNRVQAEKYAKRFFNIEQPAFLNSYEWIELDNNFTKKVFDAYDDQWLDYVVLCRRDLKHEFFDVVEGGIADDDVFNTLDLFMSDLISKNEAIKRLKKKKPNWQVCFCNQQYLADSLHFVDSVELVKNK